MEADGALSLVLKTGMATPLGKITRFTKEMQPAMNSKGQVIVSASFDNGPDTLVLLTPAAPQASWSGAEDRRRGGPPCLPPVPPSRLDETLDARGLQRHGQVGNAEATLVGALDLWSVRREHLKDVCPTCTIQPETGASAT